MQKLKTILTGLAAIGLTLGLSSVALASVTGNCHDCHTMHNSEAGTVKVAGAQQHLLNVVGCGGCHADGGTNAVEMSTDGKPRVDDQTNPLAAGFFDTTTTKNSATSWAKEHNVADLGITLDDQASTPAGQFANGKMPPGGATALSAQLTCSGTNGCHQAGAHHADGTGTRDSSNATTVGGSYRFLQQWGSGSYVYGIEDSDWEYTNSATDHNTYYGVNDTTGADTNTISAFCASCHTNFHSGTNVLDTSSEWIRHPTDFALPAAADASKEYYYNSANGNNYSVDVPVAVADLTAPLGTGVSTGGGTLIVACVSCHRAHGSDQPDMLRFDYTKMDAGTAIVGDAGTGCFVCHNTKDGL